MIINQHKVCFVYFNMEKWRPNDEFNQQHIYNNVVGCLGLKIGSCRVYFHVRNVGLRAFLTSQPVLKTRNRHDEKGGNERLATNAAYSFCKSIALTS